MSKELKDFLFELLFVLPAPETLPAVIRRELRRRNAADHRELDGQ